MRTAAQPASCFHSVVGRLRAQANASGFLSLHGTEDNVPVEQFLSVFPVSLLFPRPLARRIQLLVNICQTFLFIYLFILSYLSKNWDAEAPAVLKDFSDGDNMYITYDEKQSHTHIYIDAYPYIVTHLATVSACWVQHWLEDLWGFCAFIE